MEDLQSKIDALTAEVTTNTNTEKSALKAIQGIKSALDAALAAAKAAGATAVQLQALTDLTTTLGTNDAELAAAVVANTPAA